VRYFRVARCQI